MSARADATASVWLVVPTFNEADNIEAFVTAVLPVLAASAPLHRLLIVDDLSPDGTGEIADRLAREHDAIEVMHRSGERGLGRAYLAGFRHALSHGAELVLEMDADFSHLPSDIPRLLAAAEDADLVLGSRYVPGGGVEAWSMPRRLLSRGGCWYARTLLRLQVRDLTGGFKCFSRRVLERLIDEDIHASGYGFQVEMTYRAARAGFSIVEVPIRFHDRVAGESKMDAKIALEAAWKVPALRRRVRRQRRRTLSAAREPLASPARR